MTITTGSNSEVARLQRLFHEPLMTASHKIIDHKYHSLGSCHSQLAQTIGEPMVTQFMYTTYLEKTGIG